MKTSHMRSGTLTLALLASIGCSNADDLAPPRGDGAETTTDAGGAGGAGDTTSLTLGGGGSGAELPVSVTVSGADTTAIAFDPALARASSGALAAAWTTQLAAGASTIGYAFSTDDGATWTSPGEVAPPLGSGAAAALASDAQSDFMLAFAAADGAAAGVFASRAKVGEAAFGAPVEVTDPSADAEYTEPSIVALASGELLVIYSEQAGDGSFAGVAARSLDGLVWTRADIVRDAAPRRSFRACASSAGGRVWVVFHGPDGVALRHSDDGGATWSADDTPVSEPGESVAASTARCAVEGDGVLVVYGVSSDPDPSTTGHEQVLSSVRLGGAVGDAPVTVGNLGNSAQAVAMLVPEIAAGGEYPLLSYYGSEAAAQPEGELLGYSNPCLPSWKLHRPVVLETDRASPQRLGNRAGLVASGAELLEAFVDNASGAARVAFVRSEVPGGPCGGP